ncbi:MAG: hypothetical protein NVSMB18_20790 [Acetobacteraceae bacterium]
MAEKPEAKTPEAKKKGGKLKLILPVVLLAAGAGGWFSGIIPKLLPHAESAHAAAEAEAVPVFLDMPEIVANLNSGTRRAAFIKLQAKLELSRIEDQVAVKAAMPRVIDLFQSYLREMRPEELRGTAGTYRLREELTARTNLAAHPARILNVLFVELLIQ